MTGQEDQQTKNGLLAALGAFLLWGVLPIYWKLLQHVSPLDVLLHRIVWSMVFLALLVTFMRQWPAFFKVLREGRSMLVLLASGLVIGGNWLTFIWAVNSDRILETSLGYFANPLLYALCGRLIFGERLTRLQGAAVLLAIAAVTNLIVSYGQVPVAAILLAVLFTIYGLLRKTVPVAPLNGLLIETTLLGIPIAAYLAWQAAHGSGPFLHINATTDLCLIGAGAVTSVPLLLFIIAARRLRFVTIGIMQYIAPSVSFLVGTLLYHEPFTTSYQVTFAVIWLAVALYVADSIRISRQQPPTTACAPPAHAPASGPGRRDRPAAASARNHRRG